MDKPISVKETFQLNSVQGGLRPGTISFKSLTMDSEKFVCVRDAQADGQASLIVADIEKRISERHAIKEAESGIMNPASRIVALRSGLSLQVFDMDAKARIKGFAMTEPVAFWRWVDQRTVGIVTQTAVFHWFMDGPDAPQKVFDRNPEMGPDVQILNYRTDSLKKWLMLIGVARAADNTTVGKIQLFSVDNNAARVIEGHAGTFATLALSPDPQPCNILAFASNSATGGKLTIMELPMPGKQPSYERKNVPLQFSNVMDFPVAMHISPKHQLLIIVSSRGAIVLVDALTGAVIYQEQMPNCTVFCGAPQASGGLLCVNSGGSVFSVSINETSIVPFIKNQMGNVDMALRIASAANLGGVDDLFRAQLNNMISQGNIQGAIEICAKAPNNILRTREVLNRMQQVQLPGQPPAISSYFKYMLSVGKLNAVESAELARAVLAKGGASYVKQQFEEEKLSPSEELGDLLVQQDSETAMKIYHRAEAHNKVVNVLLTRNEPQKAVAYCKKVNYSPDWRVVLGNFIRSNPQEAVALALMLNNDMGPSPIIDPMEVTDMFVSQQCVRQATEFLSEVLRGNDGEATSRLQTKLLEINIKYSHPSVAEKIFAAQVCKHFDGAALAPLCERAGLHQRAIECYVRAQQADSEIDNLQNIRRCLTQAQSFNGEWIIDFFGHLSPSDSIVCMEDLLTNHRQHFKVVVQLAIKYNDVLGSAALIALFLDRGLYDVLYYYLGAVVPYTRDPEVHFRYIEAAAETEQCVEVERMTRESPCYDPERTKNYLKTKKLNDLWPLINVCDQHNFIDEMVRYLLDCGNNSMLEQYVQRRNPMKTPKVIGSLLDGNASEELLRNVLNAAGSMCPIEELVEEVENRGRLKLILPWLEARRSERKTDTVLFNALGKISIDQGTGAEFLENTEYYDPVVLGQYCESRDPNLSYIAYRKGRCHDRLIQVTMRNGMWKQLARYLVKEQNLDLWASVLREDTPERKHLVEAVQQTALPETKVSEEVSTAVRAFMNAEMTHELTSLLDQIVVHGQFRKNRFLENLLIMSAIKARRDKVMEYVSNLEDYDAEDIATIASSSELHDVAFAVYDKAGIYKRALSVLLRDINDVTRARAYAAKVDTAPVWTILAESLLESNELHEAIDCLLRAKNPDYVNQVSAAAERLNQYGDLIKYLTMARKESKNKNPHIDTYLVLTYARLGWLAELEEFLKDAHAVQVSVVADKCFADGLYDSAKVLYTIGCNFARLTSTLIKINDLRGALEAAEKAKLLKTWKELTLAALDGNEIAIANQCAVHVAAQAEELPNLVAQYERAGLWEEMASVLKSAVTSSGTHMGIFTELGILLAKYRPEKLLEHVNMHPKKINTHRMISVCEQLHLWQVLRVLHVNNEDWLAASQTMLNHPTDSWEHEVFKECVGHLGSSDVIYSGINFYVLNHPENLHDFLMNVVKKVDPERVMREVKKNASMNLIRPYLEAVQERNVKGVNETLNDMYLEEEDFHALRRSIEHYNNIDSSSLSQRLEGMELFEFRKIALTLHRKNKRFFHAVEVAKSNKLFQDAIESAAESGDRELIEKLLDFFSEEGLRECYAACLYHCYDYLLPYVVLEKSWLGNCMDAAMPYFVQSMHDLTAKVGRIEKSLSDTQKSQATAGQAQPAASQRLFIEGQPHQGPGGYY